MKVWILRRQLVAWPDDPVKVTREVERIATTWDTDRDKTYWLNTGMFFKPGIGHWLQRRES